MRHPLVDDEQTVVVEEDLLEVAKPFEEIGLDGVVGIPIKHVGDPPCPRRTEWAGEGFVHVQYGTHPLWLAIVSPLVYNCIYIIKYFNLGR
jgi:hypothetical protein